MVFSEKVTVYNTNGVDVRRDALNFIPQFDGTLESSDSQLAVVENGLVRLAFYPSAGRVTSFPTLYFTSQHGYADGANSDATWKPFLADGRIIPSLNNAELTQVKFVGFSHCTTERVTARFAANNDTNTQRCEFSVTIRASTRLVQLEIHNPTEGADAPVIEVCGHDDTVGLRNLIDIGGRARTFSTYASATSSVLVDGESCIAVYEDCAVIGYQTDSTFTTGFNSGIRFFPNDGIVLVGATQWNGAPLDPENPDTTLMRETENLVLFDGEQVAVGPNLIANGSFDVNRTSWTDAAGVWTHTTTKPHSGAGAIETSSNPARLNQLVSGLEVGATYMLSGNVRTKDATAIASSVCGFQVYNAAADTLVYSHYFGLPGNEWTRGTLVFKATETSHNISLRANPTGTVQFDNIALVKLPDATRTGDASLWAGEPGVSDISVVEGVIGQAIRVTASNGNTHGFQTVHASPIDLTNYRYMSAWVKHDADITAKYRLTLFNQNATNTYVESIQSVPPRTWTLISWDISSRNRDSVTSLHFYIGATNSSTDGAARYINHITFSQFDRVGGNKTGILSTFENDGLALWYRGDISSTNLEEHSGNGTALTHGSSQIAADAKFGKAVLFDGIDDYMEVAHHADLNLNGNFTIAFWAKKTTNGSNLYPGIIGKGGGASATDGWLIWEVTGTGTIVFKRDNVQSCKTAAGTFDGTWKHYAIVYDGSTTQWYVNGVANGDAVAGTWANNTYAGTMRVGWNGSSMGAFYMDDLRLYSRALSLTEIGELVSMTSASWALDNKDSGDVVAWIRMDEVSGTTLADSSNGPLPFTYALSTTTYSHPTHGQYKNAVRFDGWDDYVHIPGSPVGAAPTANVTLTAWVRQARTGTVQWVAMLAEGAGTMGTTGTSYFGLLVTPSGVVQAASRPQAFGTTVTVNSTTVLAANTWYHLAFVLDGTGKQRLYVNGVEEGTAATMATVTGLDNVVIGADMTTGGISGTLPEGVFDGWIDDVRIYNRELGNAELLSMYQQATLTDDHTDTTMETWFRFDENSGTTIGNSATGGPAGTFGFNAVTNPRGYSGYRKKGSGALEFDGLNDYLEILHNAALKPTTKFTWSAWVYLKNNIDHSTASDGFLDTNEYRYLFTNGGPFYLYLEQNNSVNFSVVVGTTHYRYIAGAFSGESLTVGQWHHLAYAFDNATGVGTAWLNGVVSRSGRMNTSTTATTGQIPLNSTLTSGTGNWLIGGGTRADGGSGRSPPIILDDLRLYDRALSTAEVAQLASAAEPQDYIDDTGLRLWQRFDTTAPLNSATSTGVGANGTYTTFQHATGKFNNATIFDGRNDGIAIAHANAANLGTGAFTISAWVFPHETNSYRPIYCRGDPNSGASVNFWIHDGALRLLLRGANDTNYAQVNASGITTGEWQHVVGTYDGTTMRIYRNNVLLASTTFTVNGSVDAGSSYPPKIGKMSYGSYWYSGKIDELRIYTRVLSDTERGLLHTQTSIADARDDADLALWHTLNGSTYPNQSRTTGATLDGTYGDYHTTAGKYGNAVLFDGVDDYISAANAAAMNPTSTLTLSAWVKVSTTATTWQPIIYKSGSYYLALNGDEIRLAVYKGGSQQGLTSTTANLVVDTWYHIAGTYDGANLRVYKDGVQLTSVAGTGSIDSNTNPLYIGKAPFAGEILTGTIEEPRIYSRALNANEIAALAAQATLLDDDTTSGPLRTWVRFDEGSGTTVATVPSSAPTASYSSGLLSASDAKHGGKSLRFDGWDDSAILATAAFNGANDFTVMSWVKIPTLATGHSALIHGIALTCNANLSEATPSDNGWAFGVDENGKLTFYANDGTARAVADVSRRSSTLTVTANTWHHVAVSFNRSTRVPTFYLDGTKETMTAMVAANGTGLYSRIGSEYDGAVRSEWAMKGFIDDFRYYNRVLTDTEVANLRASPVATDAGNTVWAPLNDASGSTVTDGYAGTSLGSISGNGVIYDTGAKYGRSIRLKENGAYITVPATRNEELADSVWAVSMWVRLNANLGTGERVALLAGNGSTGTTPFSIFLADTNKVEVSVYHGTTVYDHVGGTAATNRYGEALTLNTWHFLVYTYDRNTGTMDCYLDATKTRTGRMQTSAGTLVPTGALNAGTGVPFYIGNKPDVLTNDFDFNVDDVRIMEGGVIQSEVTWMHGQTAAPAIPTTNLVAHYKLDEQDADTVAVDSAGTRNGTIGSAVESWHSSKVYRNLKFGVTTGTNDKITFAAGEKFGVPARTTLSVSAWIHPLTTSGVHRIFGGEETFVFRLNSGWLQSVHWLDGVAGHTSVTSGAITTTGTWYHVAVVRNGTSVTHYINGVAETAATIGSQGYANGANDFSISLEVEGFHGHLDEIRVYHGVLSAADVEQLAKTIPPAIHLKLDESSGTSLTNSGFEGVAAATLEPGSQFSWVAGKFGNALYIDGGATATIAAATSNSRSVSFWYNPSTISPAADRVLLYGAANFQILHTTANTVRLVANVNVDSTTTLAAGTWYHIVGVWDTAAACRLYVNTSKNTAASGVSVTTAVNSWTLGTESSKNDGLFDEVRFFNRALTDGEVAAVYQFTPHGLRVMLDMETGALPQDRSGNGYHITALNSTAPNWTTGTHGKAVEFGGTDMVNAGNVDFGTAFTAMAWVKLSSLVDQTMTIMEKWGVFFLRINPSPESRVFAAFVNVSGDADAEPRAQDSTAISLNTWYHVAATYDGTTLKLYVNGGTPATATRSAALSSSASNLYIGNNGNGSQPWIGAVDDVRIYNYAMTQTEIQQAKDLGAGNRNVWFKLDEGNVTTYVDSASAIAATYYPGTAKFVTGQHNNAVEFSGKDYIETGDHANLSFTNFVGTIAFWMKANQSTEPMGILRKSGKSFAPTGGSNWEYAVYTSSTTLAFNAWTSSGSNVASVASAFTVGTWEHFAFVMDGTNVKVYKNGVLGNSSAKNANNMTDSTGPFVIGHGGGSTVGGYMRGALDDIRVFKRALTAGEIESIMKLGGEHLVGHWKLDETSGTSHTDSAGSGTGTYSGGTGFVNVAGQHSNAAHMGGSDHISSITTSGLAGNETYTAWVKPLAGAAGTGRGILMTPNYDRRIAIAPDGRVEVLCYDTSNTIFAVYSTSSLVSDAWSHVAVTIDGKRTVKVYVNGTLETTATHTVDFREANLGTFTIGLTSGGNGPIYYPFVGAIDDVRIYNRVLTAAEIAYVKDLGGHGQLFVFPMDDNSHTQTDHALVVANLATTIHSGSSTAMTPAWYDESGWRKHGTSALAFGGNDYVDTSTTVDSLGSEYTFGCWIRPFVLNEDQIFLSRGVPYISLQSSGNIRMYYAKASDNLNTSIVTTVAGITAGAWHHVAVVQDATNLRILVDGVERVTTTAKSVAPSAGLWRVGGHFNSSGRWFKGLVDDVRLYSRALTTTDISAMMNLGGHGLVSYHKFDGGAGDTMGTYPGTFVSAVGANYTPGQHNGAIKFGGNDRAYVAETGVTKHDLAAPFTMMVWVKPDSYNFNASNILRKDSSYYLRLTNAGNVQVCIWDSTNTPVQYASNVNAPVDTWTHVAFVFNGSEFKVYKNAGTPWTTAHTATVYASNDHPVQIGAYGTEGFDGSIDDVRIYNRELTQAEIEQCMNLGGGAKLAHYSFDESSGVTYANREGSAGSGTWTSGVGVNVTGKWKTAVRYGGTGTHRASSMVDLSGGVYTIEAWVKPELTNRYMTAVSTMNATPYIAITPEGRYFVSYNDGSGTQQNVIDYTQTATANEWAHIAAVLQDGSQKLYVNGRLVGSATRTLSARGVVNLEVGGFSRTYGIGVVNSYMWFGSIEGVRIHTSALDADEIRLAYQYGPTVGGWEPSNANSVLRYTAASEEGSRALEVEANPTSGILYRFESPQDWTPFKYLKYVAKLPDNASENARLRVYSGADYAEWNPIVHGPQNLWVEEDNDAPIDLHAPPTKTANFDLSRVTSIVLDDLHYKTHIDRFMVVGSSVGTGEWSNIADTNASGGYFTSNVADPKTGDVLQYELDAPVAGYYKLAFRGKSTSGVYNDAWTVHVGATLVYDGVDLGGTDDYVFMLTDTFYLDGSATTVKFTTKNVSPHGFDMFCLVPVIRGKDTSDMDEFPLDMVNAELHRVTTKRDIAYPDEM